MTKQEEMQRYFNRAVSGILKQNGSSYSKSEGACYYRYNDNRCAIGWLIPDKLYSPLMEGNSIDGILINMPLKWSNHKEFLIHLQSIHDQNCDREDFITHFKSDAYNLARNYNLTTEVLDNHNQK